MNFGVCGRCRRHARPGRRCPFCGGAVFGVGDVALPESASNVAAVYGAPPETVTKPFFEEKLSTTPPCRWSCDFRCSDNAPFNLLNAGKYNECLSKYDQAAVTGPAGVNRMLAQCAAFGPDFFEGGSGPIACPTPVVPSTPITKTDTSKATTPATMSLCDRYPCDPRKWNATAWVVVGASALAIAAAVKLIFGSKS